VHSTLAWRELQALRAEPRYADPLRLERHGFQAYSQADEDGILQEIFARIGEGARCFAEIGVGSGIQNNTVYLLYRGWRGTWVDAGQKNAEAIRAAFAAPLADGTLRFVHQAVTAENAERVLREAGVPEEPDLLSVDIDGNDYHVWRALAPIRARVVVIEYNARFAPPTWWVMPYAAQHTWQGDDRHGASLSAFTELGERLGYALVGCNLVGTNAFFVRRDLLAGKFASPHTAERFYQPLRHYLVSGLASGRTPAFSPSAPRPPGAGTEGPGR
jgi:hypothetical protein